MTRHALWSLTLLILLLANATAQQSPDVGDVRSQPSASGHFQVSFTSQLEPIAINQIHSWVLHVEDRNGRLVEGAQISVTGGMPAHDHGLPTRPLLTRYLGDGDYLIEGMKFHMNGAWEVVFTISAAGNNDSVLFRLVL